MSYKAERKLLQACIAVGGCVPVFAGVTGMLSGLGLLSGEGVIAADSHFRYLSGLLFGIGILFWQAIPAIETKTAQVRLLCVPIVIGGCARLAAALFVAVPPLGMLFAIGMELLVTPGLCLWQARIARIAREQIGVDGERKNIK